LTKNAPNVAVRIKLFRENLILNIGPMDPPKLLYVASVGMFSNPVNKKINKIKDLGVINVSCYASAHN
jgi:hypothetical protein